MKRVIPAFLCAALLSLPVPAGAAAAEAPQPSAYCAEGPMFPYQEIFWEMERNGLSSPLTKAAAAEFFAGLDGADLSVQTAAFADVDGNTASAAAWAVENGILPAKEDGSFSPGEKMDREELSLAIQAWLRHAGKTLPVVNETFYFEDRKEMSARGLAAAAYMQRSGVMTENDQGNFDPAATVTVAEAEGIFLRVLGAMSDPFPDLPVSTVPESQPVDNGWFDDACFIGHSQVVGMQNCFDLEGADYYCYTGYSALGVLNAQYTLYNGKEVDFAHAVASRTYNKVYIMLGINDCSQAANRIENFKTPMRRIIEIVREAQPQAVIYLLSLAPVGRDMYAPEIFNPENITLYCQALKDLSREFDTEYIDIFRFMADVDGYMSDEFNCGDDLHFKSSEYPRIEEFLKCHT